MLGRGPSRIRLVRAVAIPVAALCAVARPVAAPDISAAVARIDALARAAYQADPVGSVTIGVVAGHELAWTRSYGFADPDAGKPATRDSVYRVGSITKQLTGLMLLQLVERGRVRLSDPVERHLPEINRVQGRTPGSPPVTLVQLATMTAGLAREPDDLPTFLKGPVAEWEKVLLAALPRTKFAFEPGTRYHYSNIGYAVLGAALARAAGQPYVDYVRRHILEPLGMTRSAFEPVASIAANLAKGHAVTPTGVDADTPAREHRGRGYKVPNGALYTTVDDLARFVAFELGEGPAGVLSRETLEDTYARTASASGDLTSGYGIGFQVTRRGGLVAVGHGGSVAGYQAAAYADRAARRGVIVLRSAGGGTLNVSGLALQALEILSAGR